MLSSHSYLLAMPERPHHQFRDIVEHFAFAIRLFIRYFRVHPAVYFAFTIVATLVTSYYSPILSQTNLPATTRIATPPRASGSAVFRVWCSIPGPQWDVARRLSP